MDSLVTERVFEEALTKKQLDDILKKKIRPVHWVDGVVSYFRVQKIIDLLQEEDKPLDPNLDVAIAVLSAGKAKIRNQSYKDFCHDIKAKMDDLEAQTDEDLQQPVECLVPGCFPIGPECESLGISGDILFDRKKSFPGAIDPASFTNRVLFELSEYVARIKESYETLAGWIKKIMGWGDEYDLTPKMVEDWCVTLMRDTKKKKKSSLSLAQKHLLEKFQFPGLVPNTTTVHGNEDIVTPSSEQPGSTEKKRKSDKGDTSLISVEFSGDDAEDDKEQDMDISGIIEESTQVDNTSSKKKSLVSSPPDEEAEEGSSTGKDGDGDANNNDDDEDRGSDKNLNDREEKEAVEASTSQSLRKTSSRSAAKAALSKISTPEPKRQSLPSKGAVVAPAGKKETRPSTPKNTARRAPAKKNTSKVQMPTRSTQKSKRESSEESSSDEEDDEDEEDEDEEDDEDEDDDGDDSSMEEGEVKTPRRRNPVNTSRVKREIAEATKLFTTMSKVVNTLKKEMRIAMDYLESETAKICKNLQKAEKKLDDVMKVVKLDKAQSDSEDDEEEESSEEEESEEEESEEEKPVRITRRSQETKKITVQVKPGIKAKLKRPLVKVTRLTRRKGSSRTPAKTAQSTEVTKSPAKVSRQNGRSTTSPRTSRSTRSGSAPKENEDEIQNFDKEKLFSSRVSVSLMKISEDLVQHALEKDDHLIEDSDEDLLGSSSKPGPSSSVEKLAKKSARKNPSRRGPESKVDSEGEEEMEGDDDHDHDGDLESVKEGELSNKTREKSGRFVKRKNIPRKTADLCSEKSSSSNTTSESSKIAGEESQQVDSDNADVEENSTSKKSTRSSSRKSTNGTLKGKHIEAEEKRPTRSSRSSRTRKTKVDTDEPKADIDKEGSPRRSARVNSPIENEELGKPSAIDPPYSGSEDEDDVPKKSEASAFATLAAGMSSFGDWRGGGASAKEKGKKRSLNDFVKMLNSPKRRKTESGKKASPRKKDSDHQANEKSSEEDDAGLTEEENNDDDFLEKQTEMELEKRKSISSTTGEESGKPQDDERMDATNGGGQEDEIDKEFEMENQSENELPAGEKGLSHSENSGLNKELSEDIPGAKKSPSRDSEEEFEKETEKGDDFPGDSIVGKRISHRCSMRKHGLYKWYEGEVVHKSSASELLKLDEEQFGHLNNLYTFYTVKYDDHDELEAKALEYDWDRENLKLCS